jgi:hypothetical protein
LRLTNIVTLTILFILISSNIPIACSPKSSSGSSSLEPYDEDRFYLEAEAGEQVQLTYDVSLYPVECAMYVLQEYDEYVSPYLLDVSSLSRIYLHTGTSGQVRVTVAEESGFLLVVLNMANVTQLFEYEWVRTVPGEELMILATTSTIILVWVFVCGFCLLLARRRHRQLIEIRKSRNNTYAKNRTEIRSMNN